MQLNILKEIKHTPCFQRAFIESWKLSKSRLKMVCITDSET